MRQGSLEEIARRFISAWTAGGDAVVDELADPDIVASFSHFEAPIRGVEAYKEAIRETVRYFPDLRTSADEVLAQGDRAAVRWSYSGTHQRGELYGLEATGRVVRVEGMSIYEIQGGKVVRERGVGDTFTLMSQIGAVPAPAAEE